MRMLGLLLVLTGLFAFSLSADPWPAWRGPLGTGVSPDTGTPTEWSSEENIAWKSPLRGLGISSPIVWEDRVFVTYQIGASRLRPGNHPSLVQAGNPADAGERPLGGARPDSAADEITLVLAAFARADGELLWEHELLAEGTLPEVHEKRNLATPSPVTDGERVYAWFSSGQIVAVDMEGRPVWSRHLGEEYAVFDIGWGHASSPTVYGDRLLLVCYQPSGAYLLALDKRTGEELWKADHDSDVISYSTPPVFETPDGPQMIVNSSEGVEAYDPSTGERIWRYEQASRFPIPAPSYSDGVFYMSRGYRSGPYMAIPSGARGTISDDQLAWQVDTGAPYVSSIIHYQGLVYMANDLGIVSAIDAKTGERVWQERLGGIYTASPVAADGKIYLVSEMGETLVLKAGRTAEVLARNDLGEHCMASPAIADGQLFIRTDRNLVAIGRPAR